MEETAAPPIIGRIFAPPLTPEMGALVGSAGARAVIRDREFKG